MKTRCVPDSARPSANTAGDLRLEKPQLVRHKPGRRALVRYELTDASGARHTLLGKLRAKGLDRRTPALHDALRACGFDGNGVSGVGVPRAVGVISHLGLWLQELVPGVGLDHFLAPEADTAPFARTGAALAALHRGGPTETRRWMMADEMSVLERALDEAGTCGRILRRHCGRSATAPPRPGGARRRHRLRHSPGFLLRSGHRGRRPDLDRRSRPLCLRRSRHRCRKLPCASRRARPAQPRRSARL